MADISDVILEAARKLKENAVETVTNPFNHLKLQLMHIAEQSKASREKAAAAREAGDSRAEIDAVLENPMMSFGPGALGMMRVADLTKRPNLKPIMDQAVSVAKEGYLSPKAKEFFADTGLSVWPSGKKYPLVVEEMPSPAIHPTTAKWLESRHDQPLTGELGAMVRAKQFFEEYPDVAKYPLTLKIGDMEGRVRDKAVRASGPDIQDLTRVVAHEMTHVAQDQAGMPRGTNTNFMHDMLKQALTHDLLTPPTRHLVEDAPGSTLYRTQLARQLYKLHTGEAMATSMENRVMQEPNFRRARLPLLDSLDMDTGKLLNPEYQIQRYDVGSYTPEELLQFSKVASALTARYRLADQPKAFEKEIQEVIPKFYEGLKFP